MNHKHGVLLIGVALLVWYAFVGTASAADIYVPDDYESIQWAVNNASTGDIIIVRDGTYTENVKVNKSHLTIQSENGSANCIVQEFYVHIFDITENYVNISGFTVNGNGAADFRGIGINLATVEHCNISNNTVTNNCWGIFVGTSSNNTITGNIISNNNGEAIYLSDSDENTVSGNTISNNFWCGIRLTDSSNNAIKDNSLSNNHGNGIDLYHSCGNTFLGNIFVNEGFFVWDSYNNTAEDNIVNGNPLVYLEDESDIEVIDAGQIILVNCKNITVENLDLSNASVGLEFWHTERSIISNNTLTDNNNYAIFLCYSSNNTITGNTVSNSNEGGIFSEYSDDNTITNCTILNNSNGIKLYESSGNRLRDNILHDNIYNFGVYGYSTRDYHHDIDISNMVNGKPIYYLIEKMDMTLDESSNAGYVALISCNNVTIKNLNLTNNNQGILVVNTTNSVFYNNTLSNNGNGIDLRDSNNNTIRNNAADSNTYEGILLYYSNNYNDVSYNNFSNNGWGITLGGYSNENVISYNNVNSNTRGIVLSYSSNNIISANKVFNDSERGIDLHYYSNNNILTNNNVVDNGGGISLFYHCNHNSLINNTVSSNNAPYSIVYGISMDDCDYNHVYHNNLLNNTYPAYDDGNNSWDNGYPSGGNYWSNWTLPDNYSGVYQNESGSDGIVDNPYLISGGTNQDRYPFANQNGWIDTTPPVVTITSPANGSVVITPDVSIIGTATDDVGIASMSFEHAWEGVVVGGGGGFPTNMTTVTINFSLYLNNGAHTITVTAVDKAGNSGNASVMVIASIPLDTEAGTYPSIFGTHTGTIKPNKTIAISKLYTYPCSGTGGHTKSIELYENGTLIANGSWNGYRGDWHNITIHDITGAPYVGPPHVTLLENHEYKYTIRTGSYPQIHHKDALLTANGWINCTSFVDANGKVYTDWIPAIRME